jgi:putative endonuclease
MREYHIYILTNRSYTTLYTGVTSRLEQRLWEYKTKAAKGFASRQNCTISVYYEATTDVFAALEREKQIKLMKRDKKIALIESLNPGWVDLNKALVSPFPTRPFASPLRVTLRHLSS